MELIVPTLGESITEATVSKWLKKVGDSFEADEPLVFYDPEALKIKKRKPIDAETIKQVEYTSAENLKTTWCHDDNDRDWLCDKQGEGKEFLRQAIEVKNIWTPYGD